jgi:hypothetical protein
MTRQSVYTRCMVLGMQTENTPPRIDGSLVMLLVVTVLATAYLISQLI